MIYLTTYLWKRRGIALWAISGFIVWFLTRGWLESHAAVIGPEHFIRVAVKLFYVCMAAWLTTHVDKWLAPEMAKWAKKNFNDMWHDSPKDPRITLCVQFRILTFCALCLLFAL